VENGRLQNEIEVSTSVNAGVTRRRQKRTATSSCTTAINCSLAGNLSSPKSGDYFDSVNPATEEKLAEISCANEKDVDLAVKTARHAYKNVWSKMPGRERGKYLFRIARLIQEKARELAVLETMDGGKTIKESRDIDLPLVAAHFFYYAGWADKLDYAFPGRKCGRSASRARSFRGISRC
jgi:acyl-CoA reductase-like NAD-dependent aldehyde dehydrogenase